MEAWALNIPLMARVTRNLSLDYGPKEDAGVAHRGLFIIDGKGDLQITLSDFPVGCSVDEALRLVQALEFTEEHEEVCPAGWMPGSHSQAQCEPQQGSLSLNTTRLADGWQA